MFMYVYINVMSVCNTVWSVHATSAAMPIDDRKKLKLK